MSVDDMVAGGILPSTTSAADGQPSDPYADIQWAMAELRGRLPEYRLYEDYYRGRHGLVFATDRWKSAFGRVFRKFRMNLCRTVVDVPADKLRVAGFTNTAGAEAGGTPAEKLWDELDGAQIADEVHTDARKTGDAYVIVQREDDTGDLEMYAQDSGHVIVRYDPDHPKKIAFGFKWWAEVDGRCRCNVYYPKVTLRFVTRQKSSYDLPRGAKAFIPVDQYYSNEPFAIPNFTGIVPVFHFPNDGKTGELGISALEDVVPLQDAGNKAFLDLLTAMEYVSFPQRWATGVEFEERLDLDTQQMVPVNPFKPGADSLWVFASETANVGQFPAADLGQFMNVIDGFKTDIARVSGVPLHYMALDKGGWPSGEAMKTAETRLTSITQNHQDVWGPKWAAVMSYALTLSGKATGGIRTRWKPSEPYSERFFMTNLQAKQSMGVPDQQLQQEMGYTQDQIDEFEKMNTADQAANMAQQAALFHGTPSNATSDTPGTPSGGTDTSVNQIGDKAA